MCLILWAFTIHEKKLSFGLKIVLVYYRTHLMQSDEVVFFSISVATVTGGSDTKFVGRKITKAVKDYQEILQIVAEE